MKLNSLVLWATLALGLGLVNWHVVQREQLATHGQVIFLALAPVDPRSLMQGDYMRLRYDLADKLPVQRDSRTGSITQQAGTMVVQLDQQMVASFARFYAPGTPLAANEHLLQYRVRDYDIWIGAESFFFQEGQAQVYAAAEYAELRVSPSGETLLIDLRGTLLERLGP